MGLKHRILVVDDEDDLRLLLGDALKAHGYEITCAADGEEAVALLGKQDFDLTLLDIQMPLMNGLQVLKYIRMHSPRTRAIMLTGYADLSNAMEAKEFGASDFIGKPYVLEDILTTIGRILHE